MRYLYLTVFFILLPFSYAFTQNTCESLMNASLQKLPNILVKNEFSQLQTIISTLKSSCEKNELALRMEIIQQLIQKENTHTSITQYLDGKYDQLLVQRFDDAASKNANKLYKQNPKKYQYFPLNHLVDSLLKVKAIALLQSENYMLNDKEIAVVYLFADYIDDFYKELDRKPAQRPVIDKIREREELKNTPTIGISLGVFSPLGKNPIYGNAPTFGLSVMGPLNNSIIPELSYKLRIHNDAAPFDMKYKDEVREVAPNSSHFLNVGIGYKVYDSGRLIILPKVNTGVGFIWTGLSESYYEEDEYGNEEKNISFKNINTWHNSAGIAGMLHIKRKTYIGIEANYHIIPYVWDKKLVSDIPSHYGSLEIFIRF